MAKVTQGLKFHSKKPIEVLAKTLQESKEKLKVKFKSNRIDIKWHGEGCKLQGCIYDDGDYRGGTLELTARSHEDFLVCLKAIKAAFKKIGVEILDGGSVAAKTYNY